MKLLTTFFLLFFYLSSPAQFLQVGLEWNYTYEPSLPPPLDSTKVITIRVIGDTIVDNKTVYTIDRDCSCSFLPRHLYQEGQQFYYYYEEAFHLLYDFSLEAGDTLKVSTNFTDWMFPGVDTLKFRIDSVSYLLHNGDSLRVQHIQTKEADWGSRIIENVGSTYCLFPMTGLCESLYELRCFQLPNGEVINFTIGESCLLNAIENPKEMGVKIFPTLLSHSLKIDNSAFPAYDLRIFDFKGQKIHETIAEQSAIKTIDISHWPSGIYIAQITKGTQRVFQKLIKP